MTIRKEFTEFLIKKVSRDSTIKQYLAWMKKIQEWFIENNVIDSSFNIWEHRNKINEIEEKLKNENIYGWKKANKSIKNWMSSPWNAWVAFNSNTEISFEVENYDFEDFNIKDFNIKITESGLVFSESIITRFVSSLLTKPFVLLTGLSGSGKTKIAQSFAKWICEDESQYKIIPVGSDWTNREPLLGYPNGLNPNEYILPDSGALSLIIEASKEENQQKPYILILDEMNLSHVERYFADFLSVMESNDKIMLYSGCERKSPEGKYIPSHIYPEKTILDYTTR